MYEMSNHTRLDQLPCKSSFSFVSTGKTTNKCEKLEKEGDDDECVMYYGQFSILSQKFTVQTPLMTLTS
jgi:hypothetical protein